MKRKILMLSLAVFMMSAMLVPAYSQTVAVVEGDYFLYEGFSELVEEVGNPIAQPNWLTPWTTTWTNTDQVNRTVYAISGLTVTYNVTTTYNNGSAPVSALTDDTIGTSYTRWNIGANREVGEVIGQLGATSEDLVLSDEWVWTWNDDDDRDVVTASWVLDSAGAYYCTYKNHYDKATGIIVQQDVWLTVMSGSDSATYHVYNELKETNLWTIPEFPTGTVMLLMFVAVTVSIDIYRRKKLTN